VAPTLCGSKWIFDAFAPEPVFCGLATELWGTELLAPIKLRCALIRQEQLGGPRVSRGFASTGFSGELRILNPQTFPKVLFE
jgi:hypothetical protein